MRGAGGEFGVLLLFGCLHSLAENEALRAASDQGSEHVGTDSRRDWIRVRLHEGDSLVGNFPGIANVSRCFVSDSV